MKEKIQEVQNYFKEKLLKGDFKITERDQFIYIVSIDEDYSFTIWMCNEPKNRWLYRDAYNFIYIDLTEEESILLHSLLVSDYNEFRGTMLIEQKKKQIEILKNEIEKLDERDN